MRTFAKLAAAAVLGLSGTLPAWADQVTLTFNTYQGQKSANYQAFIIPWKEKVEQATDGRVKVVIPTATMAPPPGQWQLAESGVADVVIITSDFERQRLKLLQITRIPFISPTAVSTSTALWETQKKFFAAANEFKGMKLLAMWAPPPNNFQSRGGELTTPEAFHGLKIRAQPGAQSDILRKLGAVPVDIPISETFDAISKGVVDATVAVDGAARAFNYFEYLKTNTEIPGGFMSVNYSLIINDRSWNAISPDDQQAIADVSESLIGEVAKALDDETAAAKKLFLEKGIQYHMADDVLFAAIKEASAPVADDWIAAANGLNVDGKAALDFYIETAKHAASN